MCLPVNIKSCGACNCNFHNQSEGLQGFHFSGRKVVMSQIQCKIEAWFLQAINTKWYMAFQTMSFPMTLSDIEGHFSYCKMQCLTVVIVTDGKNSFSDWAMVILPGISKIFIWCGILINSYATAEPVVMASLHSRCGHYIFALWFLCSSFFPRLISAITHWMSTILPHMVWP